MATAEFNNAIIEEFRASGGTVERFGRHLVLVHHIGAKSGIERIAPVMSLHPTPDTWLIAASKAGADANPAWYHNLRANPEVDIEVPDEGVVPVRARDLPREERDAAWAQLTTVSPGFRAYEQRTTRLIPVLELRRR